MTAALVLVVVFAATAFALSVAAFVYALHARRDAGDALAGLRSLTAVTPAVQRRDENFGPPEGKPERRRHRAPEPDRDPRYARLRASATARESGERPFPEEPEVGPSTPSGSSSANDATTAIPVVRADDPSTAEHPAPDARFRRPPPPPLPRPGAIGRQS